MSDSSYSGSSYSGTRSGSPGSYSRYSSSGYSGSYSSYSSYSYSSYPSYSSYSYSSSERSSLFSEGSAKELKNELFNEIVENNGSLGISSASSPVSKAISKAVRIAAGSDSYTSSYYSGGYYDSHGDWRYYTDWCNYDKWKRSHDPWCYNAHDDNCPEYGALGGGGHRDWWGYEGAHHPPYPPSHYYRKYWYRNRNDCNNDYGRRSRRSRDHYDDDDDDHRVRANVRTWKGAMRRKMKNMAEAERKKLKQEKKAPASLSSSHDICCCCGGKKIGGNFRCTCAWNMMFPGGHGAHAPPFPQAQYPVVAPPAAVVPVVAPPAAAVPVQYQVPVQPVTYIAPPLMQPPPQQVALAPIEGSPQVEQKMDAYKKPEKACEIIREPEETVHYLLNYQPPPRKPLRSKKDKVVTTSIVRPTENRNICPRRRCSTEEWPIYLDGKRTRHPGCYHFGRQNILARHRWTKKPSYMAGSVWDSRSYFH